MDSRVASSSPQGQDDFADLLANFGGISLSSWIGFGTSFTTYAGGAFRWRFEFACQAIPILFLIAGTLLNPESPRWLVKA